MFVVGAAAEGQMGTTGNRDRDRSGSLVPDPAPLSPDPAPAWPPLLASLNLLLENGDIIVLVSL